MRMAQSHVCFELFPNKCGNVGKMLMYTKGTSEKITNLAIE